MTERQPREPKGDGSGVHPSSLDVLGQLRREHPDAPFLTLGQTVLWDEPVKAIFCRLLEILEGQGALPSGARMVAGVHDTDYFAKLPGLAIKDTPFVMLRHNDGDTRGLWSAAGEISALFGAEVVPSRADLARYGTGFQAAARVYPGGTEALLNQETEAPLWRALVHTEHHSLIAAEVKLRDILPALRQQLHWAFRLTLRTMNCKEDLEVDDGCSSRAVARRLLAWVDEYAALDPDGTLSSLYRYLIPRIWSLVRGGCDCRLDTTTSMELFQFNRSTCGKPRFGFVDLFLKPATRDVAHQAYNDAVRGSGIYTLDAFGDGALPFDVVVPGQGRGTLLVAADGLTIETEEPIRICDECRPTSVAELAAILEDKFGPDVALVGKAVALIPMLAAEFIFVFHEKASGYTARTQAMTEALRAAGVPLQLNPMVRLKYSTWDALANVEARFHLPEHLQRAFGVAEITSSDFAQRWHRVVDEQQALLEHLSGVRGPRALLEFLAQKQGQSWAAKRDEYSSLLAQLSSWRERVAPLEAQIEQLRARCREATAKALELEGDSGRHYREKIAPLREQLGQLLEAASLRSGAVGPDGKPPKLTREEKAARAELLRAEAEQAEEIRAEIGRLQAEHATFAAAIEEQRALVRNLKTQATQLVRQKLGVEQGAEVKALRSRMERIEGEAELARLKLVRDAQVAVGTLQYGNYRPTAWWLPMVAPDGHWFNSMAATAQLRIERL